jgi:hypothetical protein
MVRIAWRQSNLPKADVWRDILRAAYIPDAVDGVFGTAAAQLDKASTWEHDIDQSRRYDTRSGMGQAHGSGVYVWNLQDDLCVLI